jgi:acyl-CoA synthetase (AMP-forming)/AMP-acid ligase II
LIWDFLFDGPGPALYKSRNSSIAGFTNAATKERVRYDELKEYATYISSALVNNFGLASGDTVALFGPNTIWYPVALFSTVRVGEFLTKPPGVVFLVGINDS